VVHGDALDRRRWEGKEEAVVECELGVEAVSEDDVGQLGGEDGIEIAHLLCAVGGDDAGGVEQPLETMMVCRWRGTRGVGVSRVRTADGASGLNVVVDEDVSGEGLEVLSKSLGASSRPRLEEAGDGRCPRPAGTHSRCAPRG